MSRAAPAGGASDPDAAVAAQGARYAEALAPHLEPGAPYAMIDFPDHSNVGDSAIYLGQMRFLDGHAGRPPDYVCSTRTYRRDVDRFCPEGPILIQGGGNLGDLYPQFQALKDDVLERHRHRKIVQLPQSIHFRERSAIERVARLVDAHPDYTLLVRDEPSREFARAHFQCPVALAPDGAYNIGRLTPRRAPAHPVMALARRDRESTGVDLAAAIDGRGPITDWKARDLWRRPPHDVLIDRVIAPRLPSSAPLMRRRERMFRRFAQGLVRGGVEILSQGRVVVTDRLHGHIMASLMRRPHVSLDNTTGKIGGYIALWGDDGLATLAQGTEGVREAIEAHLAAAAA